jgi:hypothetical protein
MKVIGQFRRDEQGGFLPESSQAGRCQLQKAAKIERLLQDTQRDADILKTTSSSRASAGFIEVTDTIFCNSDNQSERVRKATSLSYDPRSGEVESYSARIVGPGERIKLNYSAKPLLLELNAFSFSGNSGTVTKSLKLKEVGNNLFELSESTSRL